MTITPISNTAVTNAPAIKPNNPANTVEPKAPVKPNTDTVTISKQAVVLQNSPGYTPTEEAQESSADKATEKAKGQR